MEAKDFFFIDENQYKVRLNYNLAIVRLLSDEDMQAIINEHNVRVKIFKRMAKTTNKEELRNLAKKVEEIEFRLQTFWRFEPNRNYHTWWSKVPHCICLGTANRYDLESNNVAAFRKIMPDCIIHGN